MTTKPKIRPIAFYLPQFHPIPENDRWWGKGFTEWTNTAQAKPLFKGHHQPNIPGDLGFYDLRLPESRQAQAELAKKYGIEGFCYWHYWFGNGRTVLAKPFAEVLATGTPDFPFCLGWANESWTGAWHGLDDQIIIEQKYPGQKDFEKHFHYVFNALNDERYITVDDKPLFVVYKPMKMPDPRSFTDCWRDLAKKHGLPGIFFVGINGDLTWNHKAYGFDAKTYHVPGVYLLNYPQSLSEKLRFMEIMLMTLRLAERLLPSKAFSVVNYVRRKVIACEERLKLIRPLIYDYPTLIRNNDFSKFEAYDVIPTVLPNWDNTPRSSTRGVVLHNTSPAYFQQHVESAVKYISAHPETKNLLFVKSWNEWAEGNYMEPDLKWGTRYLEVLRDVIFRFYYRKSDDNASVEE